MTDKSLVAVAIFALVYLIILAGENSPRKLDRPAASLIGAVLMIVAGVLTRSEAAQAIDLATLALLLGMMIVIHYTTLSGLLDALARALVNRCRTPQQLLWVVCGTAGVLSALFVNDTICLLMTPLLLAVSRRTRLPAEPYLLALATSSNVGSVMTLTGNPQDILIGQSSNWSWAGYALRMVPLGAVCLGINGLVLRWLYGRQLATLSMPEPSSKPSQETGRLLDRRLATKTALVVSGLLIAFLAGAPMDLAALCAAVVLLVWANRPTEETFAHVDWALLLFFAGLFVVVEGVNLAEGTAFARLAPLLFHNPGSLSQLGLFSFSSVVGSNLFSNVPFVMLARGWISTHPQAPLLWLALAASSTFAGNLTLLGSVANLIVAQGAKEECPLGFWAFLKVGVPSTLLTTLVATLLVWGYRQLGLV